MTDVISSHEQFSHMFASLPFTLKKLAQTNELEIIDFPLGFSSRAMLPLGPLKWTETYKATLGLGIQIV